MLHVQPLGNPLVAATTWSCLQNIKIIQCNHQTTGDFFLVARWLIVSFVSVSFILFSLSSRCFIPNIYVALCTAVLVPLICLVAVVVVFIHIYQVTEQWKAYDDIYRGRTNSTGKNQICDYTHKYINVCISRDFIILPLAVTTKRSWELHLHLHSVTPNFFLSWTCTNTTRMSLWNEATNNIPLFWAEAFIPYFPVCCLLETKTDLGFLQKVRTFSYLAHTKTPISTM